MSRLLPQRPSLVHLKQQAKDLLRAYAAGDLSTRQLFAHHLPWLDQPSSLHRVVLAHALFVVAREYGFSSWPQLKRHVESLAQPQAHRPGRAAARQQRQERRLVREQHVRELAERLVQAAREQNFDALFQAFAIPTRDGNAVRAYLVEQGLYTLIIDMLLLGVEHPRDRVRFLSAQAMDHFADQRCAEPLQRLLHDPVPRVRWAAIHSLQCAACKLDPLSVGGDVVGTLITLALTDPSIKVRRVASYELGEVCADPRVRATLEQIVGEATDQVILRNARRALKRYQDTLSE